MEVKLTTKEVLASALIVGAKIRIGKEYAKCFGSLMNGQIIELVEGHFEYDNGLYTEDQTAPAWWDAEEKDFESIYHLFGNKIVKSQMKLFTFLILLIAIVIFCAAIENYTGTFWSYTIQLVLTVVAYGYYRRSIKV